MGKIRSWAKYNREEMGLKISFVVQYEYRIKTCWLIDMSIYIQHLLTIVLKQTLK